MPNEPISVEDEPLYNTREAAARLRISQRHLQYQIKARALSYLQIGRSIRIPKSSLDAFKRSRTVVPA